MQKQKKEKSSMKSRSATLKKPHANWKKRSETTNQKSANFEILKGYQTFPEAGAKEEFFKNKNTPLDYFLTCVPLPFWEILQQSINNENTKIQRKSIFNFTKFVNVITLQITTGTVSGKTLLEHIIWSQMWINSYVSVECI